MYTDNPKDQKLQEGQKNESGQHSIYLVLSEEERAKHFVRPYRDSYVHIGRKLEIKGEIISLEEITKGNDVWKEMYSRENGYAAYLKYPESESPSIGKFLKVNEYEAIQNKSTYFGGCGTVTKMSKVLSETYARNPKFYGATFCVGCNKHLPVEEFVWDGTNELVGS